MAFVNAPRSRALKKWTAARIRDLRRAIGEDQRTFAVRFRVSVETVRSWEQDKGNPSGPATVLLDQLESLATQTAQLASK